jgi:hypothetical protein
VLRAFSHGLLRLVAMPSFARLNGHSSDSEALKEGREPAKVARRITSASGTFTPLPVGTPSGCDLRYLSSASL